MSPIDILVLSAIWFLGIMSCGLVWRSLSRRRRKVDRQLDGPVNVFGPLVLPVPDDPRWRGSYRRCSLGVVEVQDGLRLYLDGRQLPNSLQSLRYCEAVGNALRKRALDRLVKKVDESVMGEKL